MKAPKNRWLVARRGAGVLLILYGLLLIPEPTPAPPPTPTTGQPFDWNQSEFWLALEQQFREARASGCERILEQTDTRLAHGESLVDALTERHITSDDPVLDMIEVNIFRLAPLIGVCQQRLPDYVRLITRTRSAVKRQSERWDMNTGKDRLYRLLFGGRAALEEVMLQGPNDAVPVLVEAENVPSVTPSTRILQATIHSGDMLVSRGGAASSGLIAVGNDYAGNFSHVGIVHVDEHTSLPTVIHSNGNYGLHTATLQDYLEDVKLRVMILRLRPDLEMMVADPELPHKAAAAVLARARNSHTPYDFEIDHHDDSKMYCSEVVAWAYEAVGVKLWMEISRVSAPGTRRWLADLGVRHFEMQEPSDLEYDPQLRVVAEWRNRDQLFLDHIDNAVTEALLEGAANGDRLTHVWYRLPFVRVMKGYSAVLNVFGRTGPVPEGLSATQADRYLTFKARHRAIRARLLVLAEEFQTREGYRAPEWQLVGMAKLARAELE